MAWRAVTISAKRMPGDVGRIRPIDADAGIEGTGSLGDADGHRIERRAGLMYPLQPLVDDAGRLMEIDPVSEANVLRYV